MSAKILVIRSGGAGDTRAIGAAFARSLPPGATLSLEGPLGAGKTEFVRGFCEGFGAAGPVTSPTYTLCNEYTAPDGRRLVHVDAFRLRDGADLEALALEERREPNGTVLVEWGDRVIDALPPDTVRVRIEPLAEEDARRLYVGLPEAMALAGESFASLAEEER